MTIKNYTTEYLNNNFIDAYCRDNNKTEGFKAGVLDGADGNNSRRKNRPDSDLTAEIIGSKIRVTGNTYPYKENLKKLGGRWNRNSRSWELPEGNLAALKMDEELASLTSVIDDTAKKEWQAWLADYNEGKQWFNERGGEILRSSPRR